MKRLGGLNSRKPDASEIGKIGKILASQNFFFQNLWTVDERICYLTEFS